jgi:GH25 family lysozyme M1 (1,4-beta-N-acetylmuramidase)
VPGMQGEIDINAFDGSREDWAEWLARRVVP